MKKYSIALTHMERQIKTTVEYQFILVKMTVVKNKKSAGKVV
jgi:hypothetical protein